MSTPTPLNATGGQNVRTIQLQMRQAYRYAQYALSTLLLVRQSAEQDPTTQLYVHLAHRGSEQ